MTNQKNSLPGALTHRLQSLVKQLLASLTKHERKGTTTPELDVLPEDNSEEMEVNITDVHSQNKAVPCGDKEICKEAPDHSLSVKKLVVPGDEATEWDPFFPEKVTEDFLMMYHYLVGMETRLFDAHLPVEVIQGLSKE